MYVAAAHSTLQTPQTGPEGELWAECGVWGLASLGDVELSGVRDSEDLCQELKPVEIDVFLAPFVMKCWLLL